MPRGPGGVYSAGGPAGGLSSKPSAVRPRSVGQPRAARLPNAYRGIIIIENPHESANIRYTIAHNLRAIVIIARTPYGIVGSIIIKYVRGIYWARIIFLCMTHPGSVNALFILAAGSRRNAAGPPANRSRKFVSSAESIKSQSTLAGTDAPAAAFEIPGINDRIRDDNNATAPAHPVIARLVSPALLRDRPASY